MKYIKRLTDYDYEEGIHRSRALVHQDRIWPYEACQLRCDDPCSIWVKASAGVPVSYTGNDDGSDDDECLVGIEHLLTQGCINAVRTCRQRCVDAVLSEQTRQAHIFNLTSSTVDLPQLSTHTSSTPLSFTCSVLLIIIVTTRVL